MRKAWLVAATGLVALSVSGCVVVIGDEDMDVDSKSWNATRSADGYIVLDRDGSYSRLGGDFDLRGRLGGDLSLVSGDVRTDDLMVGGDVSLAAGDVDFSGRVDGEASIAGGDVNWMADVGDELSIAAGDLDVSGNIAGEASLAAGEMRLEAHFQDGLSAAGDTIHLAGVVSGELKLIAADELKRRRMSDRSHGLIEISGRIEDGGQVCARRLVITSDADVRGQLHVWAEEEPDTASGSVSGNIVFTPRNGRECDDILD